MSATTASQAAALTAPLSCIDNRASSANADSPLFHGCIDWHSAVHAHFALYEATRLSGDQQYANQANRSLDPGKIQAELDYMKMRVTTSWVDNPYGYAWFLLMEQRREEVTGQTNMRPLADYAASMLAQKLTTPNAYVDPLSNNYTSAAWAAVRLHQWATFAGDTALRDHAAAFVAQWVKPGAESCAYVQKVSGFFPGCMMAVAAVAQVEGPTSRDWVKARTAGMNLAFMPTASLSSHQKALNFSSAYTAAVAAKVTGDTALEQSARDVVTAQVADSATWNSNYAKQSHWIAQMGLLALSELR